MANLVSPGYNRSTLINQTLHPVEERAIEFKGLNRKPVFEEGEMSDMYNLTSENYPILTPRKPRGKLELPEDVTVPFGIAARYGRLALIAKDGEGNVNFYYDGDKVDNVVGLDLSTSMVTINNKICFFPQKTYLEITANGTSYRIGDYGSLEASFTAITSVAVDINNEDARIDTGTEGGDFAYDDAVNINGTLAYTSGGASHQATAKVSCVIEDVIKTTSGGTTTYTLVLPRETFIELTGEGAENITFTGTIKREMPNLDLVLEWNNRLWGASNSENTIYACKLGDPKNWQYFQGTSLDSYYAQQGTDGIWTGCAAYSSHAIFFKQGSMTRIYGSSPATFQLADTKCFGVREGNRDSVTVINDKVFYNSILGIMCYDGGVPYCISEKLKKTWARVVSGADGNKYYAATKSGNAWELMVLDIDKAVWHMEDNTRFSGTCRIDNQLYFLAQDKEEITCSESIHVLKYEPHLVGEESPTDGEVGIINSNMPVEDANKLDWRAVFGPFDEFMENRKIYSRLLLRLVRGAESEVSVYILIDIDPKEAKEEDWELVRKFDPTKTGGDYIPIIPRRCDRYSIKIVGKGKCSIKSLTRKVRMGTGGRL